MWLKQLKVAIVQKDTDSLTRLLSDVPIFDEVDKIEETLYLLKEAVRIVEDFRDKTAISMQQMKKNIAFLNSAQADATAKFDIIS
jgi:hypothetical protein